MGTTAVSTLEQRLSEEIGDFLEVVCTTAIGAGVTIISTNLRAYDGGRDDYFNDWWVYITDKANAGVLRRVSDYATATGTLTVLGANLSTDGANLATVRLHRYDRDKIIDAMNDASAEVYPNLYQNYDFWELVTGNILPNSHFRDWTVSTTPDKYNSSGITAAAATGGGLFRGGAKSVKLTSTGAGEYMLISSTATAGNWPKLLDLMGQTIDFYCWANPQVANDAQLQIYTLKADGTAQTLTSTTTCPADKWTLLKLENQALNNNLYRIEFRFIVASAGKYVYFDHARVFGNNQREYLLPIDLRDGDLDEVYIQTSNYAGQPEDDLFPRDWERVHGWEITSDGTDKFLKLPSLWLTNRLIRLKGRKPLSSVSAYTDTIEIDGRQLNLWLAYAKYALFKLVKTPMSSEDRTRYEAELREAYGEYLRLVPKLGMHKRSKAMRLNPF